MTSKFTSEEQLFLITEFEKFLSQHFKKVGNVEIPMHLITRKQAARTLCISLPTLHDWTKTGKIIAYRIGSRVLYKPTELLSALTQIQTSNVRGNNHGN
jgi:excisionase family DNA binding protein